MADEKRRRVTPSEIDRQRQGAVRLAPGVWLDRKGMMHFSSAELLEYFGLPDTEEDRETCGQVVRELVARLHPGARVIEQEETTDG